MKTYLRHKISNVVDVKELIALEYLDFEGKYRNYIEKHNFWEICFVQEGGITLTVDGESHALFANQLMLIPPEQTHSYFSAQGNRSRVFVVCFESVSYSIRALGGICFSVGAVEQECIKRIIEESMATFCMDEKEHLSVRNAPRFGGQQAIFLQLEYLLIALLRRHSEEKSSGLVFLDRESFYSDLVKIVMDYFRENVRQKLSLEEICNRFNYSKSFLCKTFREQTGESLIACFNRLKVEEAQRMLDRTKLSAAEISCHLGFSEAKYFGALFKRYVGLSPIAYRERKSMREDKKMKLSDKLWNWGHLEGSHDEYMDKKCTMTPEEFAREYGVKNAFMVSYGGNIQPPFDGLAKRLSDLREIKWSVLGDKSTPLPEAELGNTQDILDVLDCGANITGGVVDDFFSPDRMERFTPEVLAKIRAALNEKGRDFWCVLYAHQLELELEQYVDCFDGITFWIWNSADIVNMEDYLEKVFALAKGKNVMLGVYLWDYNAKKPMPAQLFEQQLQRSMELLAEQKIEGIVFCSGAIGDADVESLDTLKRYVKEWGDREV